MLPPADLARIHDRIDEQLGNALRDAPADGFKQARKEAKYLLDNPNYRHIVAVMREAGTASHYFEPMLGSFTGTASEHAMFRMGAAAMWKMLTRLAQEVDDELV